MRIEKLSDAKNNLSRLVDRVRRGERVRIVVRGVPVADLVPIEDAPEDAHLEALERRGVIRRGKGGLAELLLRPGPRAKGRPTSQVVIDDREGR